MILDRRTVLSGGLAAGLAGPAAPAPSPLRIALLGQSLILHDLRPQRWPDRAAFAARLKRADLVFTDLETALQAPGAGAPTRAPLVLHAAPLEVLDSLTSLGVTAVATANNHAWDLGSAGIAAGLAPLRDRGLTFAGTGLDLASAAAPAYQVTPHGKVALVAFASGGVNADAAATPTQPGVNELRRDAAGFNGEDLARILGAVKDAAGKSDLVILYQHNHLWAPNSADIPPWQKDLAHLAIDAGAGVFVSHGAPLLQGIELYRGRPIFYDLGDFIFQSRTTDDRYGARALEGVIAECEFQGGAFRRAALTPILLEPTGPADTAGRPSFARGAAAAAILQRMVGLSAPLGVSLRIEAGRATFSA
ncbi:MAG TPA: CapA family protein [Phenylobacterium sp.]|jgi:poly-gamma-glutamate synthesis protein (capsule biosynthesis protein)|nr:CapA family protein [Phenylobacterium sp.]